MKLLKEPLRFLNGEEMEKIHQSALRILEKVGMKIDHDEALEYLRNIGCKVNHENKIVLFPQAVTQRFVDKMKNDYNKPGRIPEKMAVRYSHVRFRTEEHAIHPDFSVNTGGFCCFIYDLEGKRRPATMKDVRLALKLADALDNITFTGLPCSAQDIPAALRPVAMAAELVKNTGKLGGVETFSAFDVEYIVRIAEVVAGNRENLRKNPILVGYAEARSPLCLDHNMAEIFIAYIKAGFPQTLDTMPDAGATAPVTPAGALSLGIAETLAGLVLGYSIDENAVVGIDIIPSFCDMKSGIFRYAGAERWPLLGARIQMLNEYYGCPGGVHGGKTDACYPGVRAGIEKAISMLMPVLCGTIGIGTIGHLENAVTFSPLQLVIDNEIAGYVRRCLRGIEVTDETLALDEIIRTGTGGNFLESEHTIKHLREEIYLSPFFHVLPWQDRLGNEDIFIKNARDKVREIEKTERKSPLTPDQIKAVDEIVNEAGSKIKYKPHSI